MNNSLFQGKLVRLVAPDPDTDAEAFARWSRDSEYVRLLDTTPARPWTARQTKEEIEKMLEQAPHSNFFFHIRTVPDNRLIGMVGLDGVSWTHGDTFLGIGIGERECWSKGYGTEATELVLRYAFTELNLYRVSLNVFEYNSRAIRCYEKVGFVVEGRQREFLNREGRRWDLIYMGILRQEWEARTERDTQSVRRDNA